MSAFKLQSVGMMMESEPGNPQEIEGVLDPAAVPGSDGGLYSFLGLVRNWSIKDQSGGACSVITRFGAYVNVSENGGKSPRRPVNVD
jgi:hypothetical protein